MHDNWYEKLIHQIIHECRNVTIQVLHRVENIKNYFSWHVTEGKKVAKAAQWKKEVHVTALRYLRVKPRRRGLNRRLKPGLRGGTGSPTLPNHVTRKRTVNATFARSYYA
jgi:hypothetical protein